MLSRVHNKLGTAGLVVAIVALVAALTGAAFAAGGLTKQQEKQVKKIAKKFAGKNGAQGPAGPQGIPGPKGDQGAKGDTGDEGNQGLQGDTGEAGMCSEENPECVLGSGGLLTGMWSVSTGPEEAALASISFPVRVTPAPVTLYPLPFKPGGFTVANKLEDGGSSQYEWTEVGDAEGGEEAYKEACPGSFETPEAEPGFLCIYPNVNLSGDEGFLNIPAGMGSLVEDANEFGITMPFHYSGSGTGEVAESAILRGSWAVASE